MLEVSARYPLTGMSCVSCAGSIETLLNKTSGIKEAHVNFNDHAIQIKFFPELINPAQIQSHVQSLGFGLLLPQKGENALEQELTFRKNELAKSKKNAIEALGWSVPTLIMGMLMMHWKPGYWISAILSLGVLTKYGKHFFKNAFIQLKRWNPGMDLLIALSTGVSWVYSFYSLLSNHHSPNLYFESASLVIAFVLTGKWLEEKARFTTSNSIQQLMRLQQTEVEVVDSNGKVTLIQASLLEPGMKVRIKAGGQIVADGWLEDDEILVNEQLLTGESVSVSKLKGDPIWAGTLNGNTTFQMIASATGEDTRLAQLIRRVREAQNSKAPVQKLADQIAKWFVPIVMVIASISWLIWGMWGGASGWEIGLNAFLSVLVVACPCALGLATPTALMVGLGKAAEHGMLIRNAEVLEKSAKLTFLFLDKTGTLTTGHSKVVLETWWPNSTFDENELKSLFLGILVRSNHPLASSIANHWMNLGISEIPPEHTASIPGSGTWGRYQETILLAGNRSLMMSQQAIFPNIPTENFEFQEVWCCIDKEVVGLIRLQDSLKLDAPNLIKALKEREIGIALLSGDKRSNNLQVAETLGISQQSIFAEVGPEAKAEKIRSYQLNHSNQVVGMVGDGINDSEALSLAQVSIAMGKGADLAKESADVVLTGDQLSLIIELIQHSKKVMLRIKQNLTWAFGYNLLAIPLAAGALIPWGWSFNPMWAGTAMALSSLSVVLNALRPYRFSKGLSK